MNVLSDGYVSGIVEHLSKDELARYDAEQSAAKSAAAVASSSSIRQQQSGNSHNKDSTELQIDSQG